MTSVWIPDTPDNRYIGNGLDRRYPDVTTALPKEDIAFAFHLNSIYWYTGFILRGVEELASEGDEVDPITGVHQVPGALFDIQEFGWAIRDRSLRPFTLLYTRLLLQADPDAEDRGESTTARPVLYNAAALREQIQGRLQNAGVRRAASERAGALVALAASCVHARREIAAMADGAGPPLPQLWRVLHAAEQLGWWIDEIHPWLHPLALRLVDQEEEPEGTASTGAEGAPQNPTSDPPM